MIILAVFDGDEFTKSLKKMDDEHEKRMLKIKRKALKKSGQEELYELLTGRKITDCELKRENLMASNRKIDAKLLEIMDEFEKDDCGNSRNVGVVMHDLKKVEKNFHDLIRSIYKKRPISFELPEITEKLLTKQAALDMPETFGGFFYFLAIEDEKPVLYVGVFSRMDPDLDRLCIVDEQSYRWIEDGSYSEKLGDVFK